MQIIPPVRVKVSCVSSPEEARLAVQFGAAAIGVASDAPSSLDLASDEDIAAIADAVGGGVGTFLLTARSDPADIADRATRCRVNTVQLWDPLPLDQYAVLRRLAPGLSIAQTIHVTGDDAVAAASELSMLVDALVLASSDPEPPFRWVSPHGRTHDWEVSRRIVEASDRPVILSGGLDHRNVADAIRQVRPYAVEVCSGVRENGALNTSLLVQFLESVGRLRSS